MNRVSKVVPPKRVILRDISLSFFPGAKIGVLGLNGSGKSTLLRIMGGIDTSFDGEARPQSGIRIGFLPQEPQLDAALNVRSTVMEGVGETFRQVEEFNRISEQFAHPMTDEGNDRAAGAPGTAAGCDRRPPRDGSWSASSRSPRTRCACRRGRRASPRSRAGSGGAWRCAGCCSRPRTCCCSMSPPIIWMQSRSPGSSATSRSTRAR